MNQTDLLLHVCCGPCALGVYEILEQEGWKITHLFYNPNIHPYDEYCRRLEGFYQFLDLTNQRGVAPFPYQPREYFQKISLTSNRCVDCYRFRFQKVADWGKNKGFHFFTTTLSISPYQNQDNIFQVGEQIGCDHDMVFLKKDFLPFYQKSKDLSKRLGFYRQKYCGCIYSMWEGDRKRLWKSLFGRKPS